MYVAMAYCAAGNFVLEIYHVLFFSVIVEQRPSILTMKIPQYAIFLAQPYRFHPRVLECDCSSFDFLALTIPCISLPLSSLPPISPFPLSEVQRELKLSESHCQVLTEDKAQLESQLAQLTNLSGDSSKQLSFLSEQLKEKEK